MSFSTCSRVEKISQNDPIHKLSEFLLVEGHEFDFDRRINPPGWWLRSKNGRSSIFLPDSIIEDNSNDVVIDVLFRFFDDIEMIGSYVVKYDLKIIPS